MQSVAERNLELTLEEVRAQIVVASAELSDILARQTREIDHTESVCARMWEEVAEERNRLQVLSLDLELREHAIKELEARKLRELLVIKQQVRDAMSELARLNSWIATADSEYEVKTRKVTELDAEIATKEALAGGILSLREQLAREEENLGAFRLESTLQTDDAIAKQARALKEADAAEGRRDAALADADAALKQRDVLVREKSRIQSDLEIYIRRVETKYNEAFPELRMIL